jgi:hypothetical protein
MIRTCLSILISLSIFLVTSPGSIYGESYLTPRISSNFGRAICPSNEVKRQQAALFKSLNQQSKSASPQVDKIRRDVQKIGVGGQITVYQIRGNTLHGTVTKINQDEFEIAEVDLGQIITIQYRDVKKVRSGIIHGVSVANNPRCNCEGLSNGETASLVHPNATSEVRRVDGSNKFRRSLLVERIEELWES